MYVILNSVKVVLVVAVFVYWTNQACRQEVYIPDVSNVVGSLFYHTLFLVVGQGSWILSSVLIIVPHSYPDEQLHHENASDVDAVLTISDVDSSDLHKCQCHERFDQDCMPYVLSGCKQYQRVYNLLLYP